MRKTIRFSSIAVFLFVILVTMLLSRLEESRKTAVAMTEASDAVPVLMYHHLLSRKDQSQYSTNAIVTYTEDFEAQLQWLQAEGYETISPTQLEAWFFDGAPLPKKPFMITFDDGYMSNYIYAYPLLKQYGFSAVIFSVTGKISEQEVTFQPNQINMLDTASMQAGGDVFYYASHTHDLHTLHGKHSALVETDTATADADIQESLTVLKTLPSGCTTLFSYPYGNYSDAVIQTLQKNGIRLAFRASKGKLTRESDPFALPRYPVSYTVSLSTFKKYFGD